MNNYSVVISKNIGVTYNYFQFCMVNKKFTYTVNGTLKFLPEDESKAKQYLDEILKNTSFNE